MAAGAIAVGLVSASSALANGTETWTGQGTTDGALNTEQCDSTNAPYLHWILTANGATSATITINGVTHEMTQKGQGGQAAFYYDSDYLTPLVPGSPPDGQSVTADYTGSATGNTNLVISHGCSGSVEHFGTISGMKYYDSNGDGKRNAGEPPLADEPGIANWPINAGFLTVNTIGDGTFSIPGLSAGTYQVAEQVANAPWVQTGNLVDQTSVDDGATATLKPDKSYEVTLPAGADSAARGLNFGNICLGKGGGLTLGFWSNKNGQGAQFGTSTQATATLGFLSGLNLRTAAGSNFDPTNYSGFRSWLLNATSTNMAYMLSAQLAAMELNVRNGNVNGSSYLYAPGTHNANANGYITVNALMAEANDELGLHGLTTTSSPDSGFRGYQEGLKNALDRANNDQGVFIQAPGSCPTPTFPSS